MVNSPLIRPYLLGGGSFGGGTLDSHDHSRMSRCVQHTQQFIQELDRRHGKGMFQSMLEFLKQTAI